jgi:casein kinase II subunit alpha
MCKVIPSCSYCYEIMGGLDQFLGIDELNAYLSKYCLELDPHLEALVGKLV